MIAPMVNSATAEALRPGALAIAIPRSRAAARSMLTLPAAGDDDQLERRHALEHRGRERRELGDRDLRRADKGDDRLGVALVFLEAVHPRLDIAVPHRLVGPRQLHRFDIDEARRSAPRIDGFEC